MKRLLLTALLAFPCVAPAQEKTIDIPVSKLWKEVRLIGTLGQPLGKVVTIQGLIVRGTRKAQDGPQIRVLRVEGKATQEDIVIQPFEGWGIELIKHSDLEYGRCYEWEGYETGGFSGTPHDAMKNLKVHPATTDHHFSTVFIYHKAKKIEPIRPDPADFIDRKALIPGKALSVDSRSYIAAADWMLLLDAQNAWPKDMDGKDVEAHGIIRKTAAKKTFLLEDGTSRLVQLKDQFGRKVVLRGLAQSNNGNWWLNYRDEDIFVEGMKDLPKWADQEMHWKAVEIEGVLERAKLPPIQDQVSKSQGLFTDQYIVRKPTWKPLDSLLAPEIVGR